VGSASKIRFEKGSEVVKITEDGNGIWNQVNVIVGMKAATM
jgi:hypothetical protein